MLAWPDGDANVTTPKRMVVGPIAVTSARAPMEEATPLLAPDVVTHMGGYAVQASRRDMRRCIALPDRNVTWLAERADGTLARTESH